MYPKFALGYNAYNLFKAVIAAVIFFSRASGCKTRSDNRKNNGLEETVIVRCEGTIYENLPLAQFSATRLGSLDIADCNCLIVKLLGENLGFIIRTPSLVRPKN
jgi:hypothetical protein